MNFYNIVRKLEFEVGVCFLRKMEIRMFSWEWRCGVGGIELVAVVGELVLGVIVGV